MSKLILRWGPERDDRLVALKRTQDHVENYSLGHVRLYRDELDQIVRAVAEVGEPVIEGPGFTASSEKDLADPVVPEKLDWLTITASRGERQLRVTLNRSSAVVEATEPDTQLHGVTSRVHNICRRNTRWTLRGGQLPRLLVPKIVRRQQRAQRMFTIAIRIIGVYAVAASLLLVLRETGGGAEGEPWIAGWVAISFLPLALFSWSAWTSPCSALLINAYRTERPTF